jgi:hypothetical protein
MNIKDKLKKAMGLTPAPTQRNPAFDALDRLDDGSAFWKKIRKDLTKAEELRARDGIFLKRNMEGQQFEKDNDIDNAIKAYEANMADERTNRISTFPHDRLMEIYHTREDYDNEIRVIEKVLSLAPHIMKINVLKYQYSLQIAMALRGKTRTSR